jgi:3',5'-cyclic AMP phosphodiesterase CpdA
MFVAKREQNMFHFLDLTMATTETSTHASSPSQSAFRFTNSQKDRTLIHPSLPQPEHEYEHEQRKVPPTETQDNKLNVKSHRAHSFVVCADTQFGMTERNASWETEMEYSVAAVDAINRVLPRPLFCCVCGDLVDMTAMLSAGTAKVPRKDSNKDQASEFYTTEECNDIQTAQNKDFIQIWDKLHSEIALICLCGNHDVGNRPDHASIQRFTAQFGDDYLAFWAEDTYNIVLNTSLFNDPTTAQELYREQLEWLETRLVYASDHSASHIFVFGHHPWFLYRDDETAEDLDGLESPYPTEWGTREEGFPDSYFHIPIEYRTRVMELFRQHKVSAAFSGHFHQNLVSKSSFGMDMIVTSSLSLVFDSTGKPAELDEPNTRGIRVVNVPGSGDNDSGPRTFQHKFISL